MPNSKSSATPISGGDKASTPARPPVTSGRRSWINHCSTCGDTGHHGQKCPKLGTISDVHVRCVRCGNPVDVGSELEHLREVHDHFEGNVPADSFAPVLFVVEAA